MWRGAKFLNDSLNFPAGSKQFRVRSLGERSYCSAELFDVQSLMFRTETAVIRSNCSTTIRTYCLSHS
jgi:hypothetical protein